MGQLIEGCDVKATSQGKGFVAHPEVSEQPLRCLADEGCGPVGGPLCRGAEGKTAGQEDLAQGGGQEACREDAAKGVEPELSGRKKS